LPIIYLTIELSQMKKIFATVLLAAGSLLAHAQYENTTIKIGQQAPEIVATTPAGKEIKLSDVNKGRIVLVDFWASWCHPCRMANPQLVSLYNKYSAKKFKGAKNGFTVLSVSLDNNKDNWMKAIDADGLKWENHISDLGGWRSKIAATYGVQFIPQSMLVDATGHVIGVFTNMEAAAQALEALQ
jgi:thiol-disulfide isomerase/thioredoxin